MKKTTEKSRISHHADTAFLRINQPIETSKPAGATLLSIYKYEHLTEAERRLFIRAHQKNLSSLTSKERERYGLGNVVEVKSNPQQAAIDVRFLNGEQRQFTAKGTWY